MRKKIVAGNWKMNMLAADAIALVNGITAGLPAISDNRQVVIAPPFVWIQQVSQLLEGKLHISTAAQNCHTEASGAYTGEVSAAMVKSAGAASVIIGHSERREYFKEDSVTLVKKIDQALANGLRVIFCCGEPLEIRDAETQNSHIATQVKEGLFHLNEEQLKNVVIAYEPIWAIGTGRTASSAQAQDMHANIRSVLAAQYGAAVANDMSILYGGSCNQNNAAELFACPDVDGGLIGGAALKADTFLAIINAMVAA